MKKKKFCFPVLSVSLAVKSVAIVNVLFSIEAKRQLAVAIVSANGYHDVVNKMLYEIQHQELNKRKLISKEMTTYNLIVLFNCDRYFLNVEF